MAHALATATITTGPLSAVVQDRLLDVLYLLSPYGMASQASKPGSTFSAFLDTSDDIEFGAAVTTHKIRYRVGVSLAVGDTLSVDGATYKVVDVPRQINRGEKTAALVLVSGTDDDPDDWMIDLLYDAGDFGMAILATASGNTFPAFFETSPANAWEHAAIRTHQLRVRATQPLADGSSVTIDGATYSVVGTPKRLSRSEKLAHLVRQS